LLVLALVVAGAAAAPAAPEPLVDGLGTHTRLVTTKSAEAQKYFDQGLRFVFGFNHAAAIRAFQQAATLDPSCAMAHWGIALACGPHINLPVVFPPSAALAWDELGLAQKNASSASTVEHDLINALAKRYANPQPDDRSPLDLAYANAMREVWKKYPHDADIGVLFAEAMMDLRPWDQWTLEGQPQPGTDEILATLDAVLKLDINHPFANHLYIHAIEASPHPERALPAADRLAGLQPALAHNVHMPSHVYIRCGRWFDAVDANLRAVAADKRYREIFGPQTGFLIVYVVHNEHMLAYAAMMTGQGALALDHIRAIAPEMPEADTKDFGLEAFLAMQYEVMVRFGKWDEILAAPDHPDWMPFTRTMRHAARGIAFAAKGDPKAARTEQAEFLALAKTVPADELAGNNKSVQVLTIATPMLEGEILYREGKVDEGLKRLREAVTAEDLLRYDEPPDWLLPVRHSLGAALMQQRRFAEAEKVYREDLAQLPENGWSLYGLAESLRQQGKKEEAAPIEARFQKIWAKADLPLHSSCLCQPGL
jgi:tetratricopeptide (TPR) repeat protein